VLLRSLFNAPVEWSASFGLIFMIFFRFESGFATTTEISAFAVLYAIAIGALIFCELSLRTAAASFVQAVTHSGWCCSSSPP
jgi:TRAP-type C4-dicarboxylate transport system permease large subunit